MKKDNSRDREVESVLKNRKDKNMTEDKTSPRESVAAEQLGRICFMMEIDPKYASAIVRRYAAWMGGMNEIKLVRQGKVIDNLEDIKTMIGETEGEQVKI